MMIIRRAGSEGDTFCHSFFQSGRSNARGLPDLIEGLETPLGSFDEETVTLDRACDAGMRPEDDFCG
ncbi:MAG: hypothetical protein AAGJ28_20090 [Pseudomonadota bacterium]